MSARREEALARLAQELQVPAHLLNLYPPPANHWAALLPVPAGGWKEEIISRGRKWGATLEMQERWRDRVLKEMQRLLVEGMSVERRRWEALYGGLPTPDDSGDRCYPGAYPCVPPPCPPWPRALGEPDPCSIGDCLTCPGDVVGCGCSCHYEDDGWLAL